LIVYLLEGLDIKLITRSNRIGFKAGALKEGLVTAKGELCCFLMLILFLKRMVATNYYFRMQVLVVAFQLGTFK
jgi:hypothetical protein